MCKDKLDLILKNHEQWVSTKGKEGERANLSGAYLSRSDLSEAYLSRAYLSGADLSGANLSGANLSGADLLGANLSRANLSRANLSGATLSRANTVNTSILTFNLGKDFGFYHEGYVKIGCKGGSLDYWLENYKEIGKEARYSKEEIRRYGKMLKLLKDIV